MPTHIDLATTLWQYRREINGESGSTGGIKANLVPEPFNSQSPQNPLSISIIPIKADSESRSRAAAGIDGANQHIHPQIPEVPTTGRSRPISETSSTDTANMTHEELINALRRVRVELATGRFPAEVGRNGRRNCIRAAVSVDRSQTQSTSSRLRRFFSTLSAGTGSTVTAPPPYEEVIPRNS
jgi:hypothetical protein